MRKVWVVTEARNYTGLHAVESVHRTKALAIKHCRLGGFTYNPKHNEFNSDEYHRELDYFFMCESEEEGLKSNLERNV